MRRLAVILALLAAVGATLLLLVGPPERTTPGQAAGGRDRAAPEETVPAPAVLRGDAPPPPPPPPPPGIGRADPALEALKARPEEVDPPSPRAEAPLDPETVVDVVRAGAPAPLQILRDDLLGRVLPYGTRASREARDPQWTGVARLVVTAGDAVLTEGPTTAVRGTVQRQDGQPLAGAEVILYSSFYLRRARYDHRVVEIGRVYTDADGLFDLRPVALDTVHFGADGELLITVRHPHVADLVAQRLPRIQPGQESEVGTLVLPDTSAVIQGVVRDLAKAPVAGAVVRASGAMDPVRYDKTDRMVVLKDCPHAVTDAEGRYVLEDFAAGLHDVSIHVNIDCVLHQARLWEGVTTWSPTVRAGNAIRGRVVGPDGEPVEAAVVAGGGNWTPSNADGTFWLDNIDPGPLTLEVSHDAWQRVVLPSVDTNGDDVVIRMATPLARVELEVVGANDAPVPLLTVTWQWAPGRGPTQFTPQSPYWHDPDGQFLLIVPEHAVGARISDAQGNTITLEDDELRDGARLALRLPEATSDER